LFFTLKKTKKQKEVIESLQKELHHRVKNNLSIIDTFIEVAKEEFADGKFSKKLTELQNRINSINEVHQQLYKNEDVTNLNLKKYIDTLSSNVANSFSNENISIEKSVQGKLNLHADKSFPVGLIINEFLTNSYKYAFGTNTGIVKIEINDKGNTYELALSDNGKGLPENFDIETTESFGLRIIKLLAEQLNGNFALTNNNGVALTIKFPK
jgi:two-component sensor histidine kinase